MADVAPMVNFVKKPVISGSPKVTRAAPSVADMGRKQPGGMPAGALAMMLRAAAGASAAGQAMTAKRGK